MDSFDLRRFIGREPRREPLDEMPWASIAGIGALGVVRWKRDRAAASDSDGMRLDQGWLMTSPVVGQSYWTLHESPFSGEEGEPFWSIYDTPLAEMGGYLNEPQEIGQMLLVKGVLSDLERVPSPWGERGIARVHVSETMSIADLLALPLSPYSTPERLARDWSTYRERFKRCGDLVYIENDMQGTVDWTLVYDTHEVTDLLIYTYVSEHGAPFWAGRVRLRQGQTMIGAGSSLLELLPARAVVELAPPSAQLGLRSAAPQLDSLFSKAMKTLWPFSRK